jgi:hypothetical protein
MKSWDGLGPLQEGILATGGFSRIGVQMDPKRQTEPESRVLDLTVQCEVANHKSVGGELDWQFIPNESGRPTLVSAQPAQVWAPGVGLTALGAGWGEITKAARLRC